MMDSLRNSFKQLWDEIKKPFLATIHKAFLDHELSSSEKQNKLWLKCCEKKTMLRDSLRTGGWYQYLIQIWKL